MGEHFLSDADFHPFLSALMTEYPVIGPIAKKSRFIFSEIQHPGDLRLDYDVTLLPPKSAFFPPRQKLLEFSLDGVKSCIKPRTQVLFGVHFYDMKAIDMLDQLFAEGHRDENYLAYREATIVIASSIQKVSKRAFWGSVGTQVKARGHDGFLTRIAGGYLYEPRSTKGESLLRFGNFQKATERQCQAALGWNDSIAGQCPEKLNASSGEIAQRTREVFSDRELWKELSKDCFSCGSCVMVCPTCYCFDVQDRWNLDQVSGYRYRTWDGCMTRDFARVSLGAGGSENFREHVEQRFRHRVMRKTTYLNPKLSGPACVGCGRCSEACVPDIADPVRIIERVMQKGEKS